MSDSVSGLLRWILAHDIPPKVILTCSHSPAHDPGRFDLAVVLQGCVSHAPLGLPAQILACGVSRVEYTRCPHDPAGAQRMHAIWQGLLDRGILIREVGPDGWLRVSVGTVEENAAFMAALKEVM